MFKYMEWKNITVNIVKKKNKKKTRQACFMFASQVDPITMIMAEN